MDVYSLLCVAGDGRGVAVNGRESSAVFLALLGLAIVAHDFLVQRLLTELFYDRGNLHEFMSIPIQLAPAGTLLSGQVKMRRAG